MLLKQKINIQLVFTIAFFIGMATLITLIAAAAVDEGTGGNSPLLHFLARMYNIFRFPTHSLFWVLFSSGTLFMIGLILNTLFYGLMIERLSVLAKEWRTVKSLKSQ